MAKLERRDAERKARAQIVIAPRGVMPTSDEDSPARYRDSQHILRHLIEAAERRMGQTHIGEQVHPYRL